MHNTAYDKIRRIGLLFITVMSVKFQNKFTNTTYPIKLEPSVKINCRWHQICTEIFPAPNRHCSNCSCCCCSVRAAGQPTQIKLLWKRGERPSQVSAARKGPSGEGRSVVAALDNIQQGRLLLINTLFCHLASHWFSRLVAKF